MSRLKAPPGGLVISGRRYPSGAFMPEQYRRQLESSERARDPAFGSSQAVPNMGRAVVPHVLTFSGLMTGLARTYRSSDEALRHSVDNAHMMLNDPMIAGPLLARQHMTALLNWSVESEDEKDPKLKAISKELTDIIGRTPKFTEYRRCLLEAIWYGRYGIQNLYGWHSNRQGIRRRVVRDWVPVSGDKILFRFDDGSGDYDRDQIGFKVSASMASRDIVAGRRCIEPTGEGLAYFLEKWERKLVTLHKHYVRDGEFEDPRSGGQIHGVGLRHFLYWIWYQKQEAFAQVAEIVERTGMGFIIYFYPHGNAQARAEVEKVSQEQAHTNTILMPAEPDDTYRVEQIPPNTSGLQVLMDYIEAYLGDLIVRFILGQTLSSKPSATGMNTGVAELQKDSLFHIIRYDAINLEETLTRELLLPNRDFNYPKYRNVDFWFRISTKVAAPEQELAALNQLWQMGAEIKVADIFDRLDLAQPDGDDKTLFNPQVVAAAKQFKDSLKQPPPQMGGGAPGGPPGMPPGMPPGSPPPGGGMPPGAAPAPGADAGMGPPVQLDKEGDEEQEKERLFGPLMYRKVDAERMQAELEAAVRNTDHNPSQEQREAGNYRKGKIWWHGLELAIETPKGVQRRPEWPPMAAHYGYIKMHESEADGDHVDVFIGPDLDSELVFCVDQLKANGKTFDEHKVLIGFCHEAAARKAYLDSYTPGWKCGPITAMTLDGFGHFLQRGDTGKPVSSQKAYQYARYKPAAGQMDLFGAFGTPTAPSRPAADLHVGDTKYENGHVYTLNQNHRWEGPVEEGPLGVGQATAALAPDQTPIVKSETEKPAEPSQEPEHAREEAAPAAGPEQPDAGRGAVRGRSDAGESGGGGDLGANRIKSPEERIVISREQYTAPADRSRVPERLRQHLNDHQQDGVAKMVVAMDEHGGALLADGTGTGKTRQQLAIGQYYLDQGKKVLVIAPMEVLKANWKKNSVTGSWKNDSDALGVRIRLTKDSIEPNAVNLTTYENLAKMKGLVDENTVLILDEGHKLKNRASARSKHAKEMIANASAVMFATATPIDKVEHLDYLDRAGVFGGQHYSKTYEQLGLEQVEQWTGQGTVKVWKPKVKHSEVMRRVSGLFDRLTKDGRMIKREISMEGVPVNVHQLELPTECHDAMQKIAKDIASRGYPPGNERAQTLMQQRRQQEPYKVETAVQMAMDAMKNGRQVVIFASRVNESTVGDEEDESAIRSDGTMVLLKQALLKAGVSEQEIAEIHGGVKKNDIPQNMDRFQAGEAKVVIATIESGGTGVNLDDTKGDAARTMIMMTAPFSAVENMQAAGRIWRLKTASTPEFHYLFGDTEVDEWNSGLIGKKMKTLGASISGQVGRLDITQIDEKDFIDFQSEEPYEWTWPGEGEAPKATFSRLDNGEWGLRVEGPVKVGDEVQITRKDGSKELKKIASIVKSVRGAKIATFESTKRGAPQPKEELPQPPPPPPKPTKVYSDEKRQAIHSALQNLAAMDSDRAREINHMGFNRMDGQMGHALANRAELSDEEAEIGERLIAKYKRQIDPMTMTVATRQEAQPKREPEPAAPRPKSDNPLHDLAVWSEPKKVNTSRGARIVRTAYPDSKFWDQWRKDKEELKKKGISVSKYQGDWQLTWWEEPPESDKHARLRNMVLRYVKDHHPSFYARYKPAVGQTSMFGAPVDLAFEDLHPRGQPTNPGQFAPKAAMADEPFNLANQPVKPATPQPQFGNVGGKQPTMWAGLQTDLPGQRNFLEEQPVSQGISRKEIDFLEQNGIRDAVKWKEIAQAARERGINDLTSDEAVDVILPHVKFGPVKAKQLTRQLAAKENFSVDLDAIPYKLWDRWCRAGCDPDQMLRNAILTEREQRDQPEQHAKSADLIPGGLAAGKDPGDFNDEALSQGAKVEMEHTDDPRVAREIASDHNMEFGDSYYPALAKMEDRLRQGEPEKESQPDDYAKGPQRSPKGGTTIGGQFYPGGEWVPAEAMEAATPEELTSLARGQGPPEGTQPAPNKFADLEQRMDAAPEGTRLFGYTKTPDGWAGKADPDLAISSADVLESFPHPLHKHQIHASLPAAETPAAEVPPAEAATPDESVMGVGDFTDIPPDDGAEMGPEPADTGESDWDDFAELLETEPEIAAPEQPASVPGRALPPVTWATNAPAPPPPPPTPAPPAPEEPVPSPQQPGIPNKAMRAALSAAPLGTQVQGWTKEFYPAVGMPAWTDGRTLQTDDQMLERFPEGSGERQAMMEALQRPTAAPETAEAEGPIDAEVVPEISPEDRMVAQDVAEMFGIQNGDIENNRRLRNFLNRTARHLGFDPETVGKDAMSQAVASAQYLQRLTPQLESVVQAARGYGWNGGTAQELAARSAGAGRFLVKQAERAGYQSSQGRDEKADLTGALEFLRDREATQPNEAPWTQSLRSLFQGSGRGITATHVAAAVLGFWFVWTMLHRGRANRRRW